MSDTAIGRSRARSGYTRDYNALDALVFNVVGFSLGLALSTNPPFIGAFSPGAMIGWVILSGAMLALANGLVYGWFAGVMPATGGDYVFVSRTLGPALGFLASWCFSAWQLVGLSINLIWIVTVGVAPALQALGLMTHHQEVVAFATTLTHPWTAMIGTLLLLVAYYLFYLLGVGTNRLVIYPMFLFALLGPILMGYIVTITSHAHFVATLNSVVAQHTGIRNGYDHALATAKVGGMAIDQAPTLFASVLALPLGFLCFLGFTYSVYVGGEMRKADRSQMFGILGALAIGTTTFVYVMTKYVDMVGRPFNAALGAPDVPGQLGLLGSSINNLIALVAPNQTIALLMLVGNLLWFLLIPYVMMQVCVHNLVAWSCDKLAPPQLLRRLPGTNVPWVAGAAVCAVVAALALLNYLVGYSLLAAAALAAVAFGITGFAALRFPAVRPDLLSRLPSAARWSLMGVTLFQLTGLISVVGFGWIVVAAVFYPQISGGTAIASILYLVGVYVLGAVWYQVYHSRNVRQAKVHTIDLDALLREIPAD